MKKLKSLSIIMAVMMTSQSGVRNFAVSAMNSDVQGQSVGGTLSNELNQLKKLQEILYLDPINQENLTKQIEQLRTVCSAEEIDRELIMAMSLNYQRIPVLIPFLSKKEVNKKMLPHRDQDFLTILLKNGIEVIGLENILGLNRKIESILGLNGERKRTLEEELVVEMEKKGIEFDKSKVLIRKKSSIEKIIEEDDIERLRLLSNQTGFDPNQKICKENLQYYYREIPIISFCIEKHAIKCFKFLLLNGSNPLSKTDDFVWEYCMDGMDFGAAIGNIQIMEMIEEKGGIIGTKAGKCAARFHQNHILKWILQKQSQIDWQEVFYEAIKFDNLEGINLILKGEVIKDINATVGFYGTLLHVAAREDAVRIAGLLISKGANINAQDSMKETPLHYAAKSNASKVAELLIGKGANINAKNSLGDTPLYVAIEQKSSEVGELLISKGADVKVRCRDKRTLLHIAAWKDDIKIGELLINNGVNVNTKAKKGQTPLHDAADCSSNNMVEFLISKGADMNAEDDDVETPLSIAVRRDASKIVEFLINKGVAAENILGRPLLYKAAEHNSNKVVELLISKGADINAKNQWGKTPLHVAAEHDANKVAELLVGKGADINAKDNYGDTPLHVAVRHNSNKVVELLISKGADINAKDNEGKTPLHVVADNVMNDPSNIVEFLISKGANINEKDNEGKTPLHIAADRGLKKVGELLLSKGADIDVKDNFGRTPLHYFSSRNRLFTKIVREQLIDKGADINAKDNAGRTPLSYVAAEEMKKLLASRGAHE